MSIDCRPKAAIARPVFSIIADAPVFDSQIEALHRRVFGPGRYARTAERLREGNRLNRACSWLALSESNGQLLATVRLWPLSLTGVDSVHNPAFLGPVAVAPEVRGAGIGVALCERVIETGFAQGFSAMVLVGDLSYFSRLGFHVAKPELRPPAPIAPGRLLVRYADPQASDLQGALSVPRATRAASLK